MKLSSRASVAITVGTLLTSGLFALMAVTFGINAGAFITDRTLPAIMMASDIEAVISGAYSLPGDAEIRYAGTRSCVWDDGLKKFSCAGGATITPPAAAVSYTKDPAMLAFARTDCIYFSIIPLLMKGVKYGLTPAKLRGPMKGVKSSGATMKAIQGISDDAYSGVDVIKVGLGMEAYSRRAEAIAALTAFAARWEKSKYLGKIVRWVTRYDDVLFEATRGVNMVDFDALLRDISSEYDDVSSEALKTLYIRRAIKGADGYPEEALEMAVRGATREEKEIGQKMMVTYYRRVRALPQWEGDIVDWFNTKWILRAVPKEVTTKGIMKEVGQWMTRYLDCHTNMPFLNILTLFQGQFVWVNNYREFDHFFDFYAGKVGHVRVNFQLDGEEHDIDKLYVLNAADMCFLREHLAYNWTKVGTEYKNYAPTALDMENGALVFTKTKAMTDTLCDESDQYFSNGLIDIADAALASCKGNPSHDIEITVYIPPSRAIFKRGDKLCEEKVARDGRGGFTGTFTLFCYDFKDLPCGVNLNGVQEYVMVDYTLNPTEEPNTYLYKGEVSNEGQMRFGLNWDMTGVPFAAEINDFLEKTWDPLVAGALNVLYAYPKNVVRQLIPAKTAFPQSRLDMYNFTFSYKQATNTVEIATRYIGPAVYMNWEDIYTDEHPDPVIPITTLVSSFSDYVESRLG
jgi:hypothetical protein